MPIPMGKTICLLLFLLLLIPSHVVADQQAVEMLPMRIVMDGRERSTTLQLLNRNPRALTYRLETVLIHQEISGRMKRIISPDPEQEKILNMVRFSPRQVRIEPHSTQTVRIMTQKPANLPAGEYRCHLQVTPLPERDKSSEEIEGIHMGIVVSTSIPLIIRHGETHVRLDAEDLTVETLSNGTKALKIKLIANGNRSAYMNASLFHGKILLAEAKGFAIYQPTGQRDVSFPLQAKLPPSGSVLRLVLQDREKETLPLIREIPLTLP